MVRRLVLVLAGFLNVNLFGYAKALIDNDDLRERAVAAATAAAGSSDRRRAFTA